MGHVVNLEHKEMHQFWPLTSKPSGDSCTDFSPKDMPAKDKRANFPLDYHLELHRVFVPCARSVSSTPHDLSAYMRTSTCNSHPLGRACTHRYFESALLAQMSFSGSLGVVASEKKDSTLSSMSCGLRISPRARRPRHGSADAGCYTERLLLEGWGG